MKRILIALAASAVVGGSAASAWAQPGHFRHDQRGARQDRHEARRWRQGERLPAAYRGPSYYVSDYRSHRLRPPPRGYRWVRRDNDYLLVAATTGLIASVIAASQ